MSAGAPASSAECSRVRRQIDVRINAYGHLLLVEASTRDEALATAKTVFDQLVGASSHSTAVFDYYVTFDESGTSVAGKARWGDLPVAAPVDSEEGEELLERG